MKKNFNTFLFLCLLVLHSSFLMNTQAQHTIHLTLKFDGLIPGVEKPTTINPIDLVTYSNHDAIYSTPTGAVSKVWPGSDFTTTDGGLTYTTSWTNQVALVAPALYSVIVPNFPFYFSALTYGSISPTETNIIISYTYLKTNLENFEFVSGATTNNTIQSLRYCPPTTTNLSQSTYLKGINTPAIPPAIHDTMAKFYYNFVGGQNPSDFKNYDFRIMNRDVTPPVQYLYRVHNMAEKPAGSKFHYYYVQRGQTTNTDLTNTNIVPGTEIYIKVFVNEDLFNTKLWILDPQKGTLPVQEDYILSMVQLKKDIANYPTGINNRNYEELNPLFNNPENVIDTMIMTCYVEKDPNHIRYMQRFFGIYLNQKENLSYPDAISGATVKGIYPYGINVESVKAKYFSIDGGAGADDQSGWTDRFYDVINDVQVCTPEFQVPAPSDCRKNWDQAHAANAMLAWESPFVKNPFLGEMVRVDHPFDITTDYVQNAPFDFIGGADNAWVAFLNGKCVGSSDDYTALFKIGDMYDADKINTVVINTNTGKPFVDPDDTHLKENWRKVYKNTIPSSYFNTAKSPIIGEYGYNNVLTFYAINYDLDPNNNSYTASQSTNPAFYMYTFLGKTFSYSPTQLVVKPVNEITYQGGISQSEDPFPVPYFEFYTTSVDNDSENGFQLSAKIDISDVNNFRWYVLNGNKDTVPIIYNNTLKCWETKTVQTPPIDLSYFIYKQVPFRSVIKKGQALIDELRPNNIPQDITGIHDRLATANISVFRAVDPTKKAGEIGSMVNPYSFTLSNDRDAYLEIRPLEDTTRIPIPVTTVAPVSPITTPVAVVAPGTTFKQAAENFTGASINNTFLINDAVSEQERMTMDNAIAKTKAPKKYPRYFYLDLVDKYNGNILLKPTDENGNPASIYIFYPYPTGTNKEMDFDLYHFYNMNRRQYYDDGTTPNRQWWGDASNQKDSINFTTFTKVDLSNYTALDNNQFVLLNDYIVFKTASLSPFALVYGDLEVTFAPEESSPGYPRGTISPDFVYLLNQQQIKEGGHITEPVPNPGFKFVFWQEWDLTGDSLLAPIYSTAELKELFIIKDRRFIAIFDPISLKDCPLELFSEADGIMAGQTGHDVLVTRDPYTFVLKLEVQANEATKEIIANSATDWRVETLVNTSNITFDGFCDSTGIVLLVPPTGASYANDTLTFNLTQTQPMVITGEMPYNYSVYYKIRLKEPHPELWYKVNIDPKLYYNVGESELTTLLCVPEVKLSIAGQFKASAKSESCLGANDGTGVITLRTPIKAYVDDISYQLYRTPGDIPTSRAIIENDSIVFLHVPSGTYYAVMSIDTAKDIIHHIVVEAGNPYKVLASTDAQNNLVCSGTSITLKADIEGATDYSIYSFEWKKEEIAVSEERNYTFTVAEDDTGTYTVSIVSVNDCKSDATVTIQVNPYPVTISEAATVCRNDNALLSVSTIGDSTGVIIHWYDTENGQNSIATGIHYTTPTLSATTDYWVAAIGSNDCVSPRQKITATVIPHNTITPNTTLADEIISIKGTTITPIVYNITGINTETGIEMTWTGTTPAGITSAYNPATEKYLILGTPTTAGMYEYTIAFTGNEGCPDQLSASGTFLVFDIIPSDETCFSDCTGTITVLPAVSVLTYTLYNADGTRAKDKNGNILPQITPLNTTDKIQFENLCNGIYKVKITE